MGKRTTIVETARTPHARLRAVPVESVRLEWHGTSGHGFWASRTRMVRTVTLPQQLAQLEATGRIDNFRRAAGQLDGPFQGRYYNDSDVYKWVEAVALALAHGPDADLEASLEAVVAAIAAAQQPDGYLNTYFMFDLAADRWADLTNKHEMYCAGHLIQAAIAHHRATGRTTLLGVATRLADHLCVTFGPHGRRGTDGHEEIELAMIELFRETGVRRYLDAATFFLEMRGQVPPVVGGSPYHQDHLPVRDQTEAVGHAVRLTYLGCGLADAAMETNDDGFARATDALWESAHHRKAYVTGGLGSRWDGEAFGADYELPNDTAYAETCAAIGSLMWSWRRLLATGEARFADQMEVALYNGILAGLSLDGETYFYQNPLSNRGDHRRQPFFGTACCPPNVARLVMGLPGFVASVTSGEVWLHLYADATVDLEVPEAGRMRVRVTTRYPWDGHVTLDVLDAPSVPVVIRLRVPSWTHGAWVEVAHIRHLPIEPGTYAPIVRTWRSGDRIDVHLPMAPRLVLSHPRVATNAGQVALVRGPIVYCLEAVDHPGVDVSAIEIDAHAPWEAHVALGLPAELVALRGHGHVRADDVVRPGAPLYRPLHGDAPHGGSTEVTAVPYFAWANRAPGAMTTWMTIATVP
jgi:DUF1680 family protein